MKRPQLKELLLQSLEHERGGVKVYETALRCATNPQLKRHWGEYLEQTRNHVRVLMQTCNRLRIDPETASHGCKIVKALGTALVEAMELAQKGGDAAAAEIVACECVVLAETKDHLDWELIAACSKEAEGDEQEALREAAEEVEEQEDEHLYHTKGWCRELWLKSLGLEAVLPPPEESKHVTTAIEAAKAEKAAHPE
jgi:ferritin-like metal-binding protein YciE